MSLLDEETIATLKEVLEDEFDSLIDTFLGDVPKRIEEMHQCLGGDVAELEKPAHTLKGSSGNVGAAELFGLCERFVDEIRSGKVDNPEQTIRTIEEKFEQTRQAMLALKQG